MGDEFKFVMRLNNHSDTNNYCEAIANRFDLEGKRPFGAFDCKATTDEMVPKLQASIQCGPTTELDLPAFDWTNFPQYNNSRRGMPDKYDFDWVFFDPASNFTDSK